jgi:hypothetical protein
MQSSCRRLQQLMFVLAATGLVFLGREQRLYVVWHFVSLFVSQHPDSVNESAVSRLRLEMNDMGRGQFRIEKPIAESSFISRSELIGVNYAADNEDLELCSFGLLWNFPLRWPKSSCRFRCIGKYSLPGPFADIHLTGFRLFDLNIDKAFSAWNKWKQHKLSESNGIFSGITAEVLHGSGIVDSRLHLVINIHAANVQPAVREIQPDPRSLLSIQGVSTDFRLRERAISNSFGAVGLILSLDSQFMSIPDLFLQFSQLLPIQSNQLVRLRSRSMHFGELSLHRCQLSMIDAECHDADNGECAVDNYLRPFDPAKFSSKFSGGFILAFGAILGIGSNAALGLWRSGRLRSRVVLFIAGWSCAVLLICHGASLLLRAN